MSLFFVCAAVFAYVCVCVFSANGVQIMPEMRGEQGAYAALLPRQAAAAAPYPARRFHIVGFVLDSLPRSPPLPLLQSMLSKMLQACRMLLGNQIKLVGKT